MSAENGTAAGDAVTSYSVDEQGVAVHPPRTGRRPATRSTPRCWSSCSSTWRSPAATRRCGCWSSAPPTTSASRPAPTSASSSTRRARSAACSSSPTSTTQIVDFPKPTIAACHGDVVGGGAEIAVACDMRVGGANLRMRFPGAALGVPVGPARLVTLCGLAAAKYLLLSSRTVGADEALRLGLVNRVAPAAGDRAGGAGARRRGRRPPARGGRPAEADAARVGRRRRPLRRRGPRPGRVGAHRPRSSRRRTSLAVP